MIDSDDRFEAPSYKTRAPDMHCCAPPSGANANRAQAVRDWLAAREEQGQVVLMWMLPTLALQVAQLLQPQGWTLRVMPTEPRAMPTLMVVPGEELMQTAFPEGARSS